MDSSILSKFLLTLPGISCFANLSCYLREMWFQMDSIAQSQTKQSYDKLSNLIEDSNELLLYIQDIFNSNITPLNNVIHIYIYIYKIYRS